jgi:hypothetical protein
MFDSTAVLSVDACNLQVERTYRKLRRKVRLLKAPSTNSSPHAGFVLLLLVAALLLWTPVQLFDTQCSPARLDSSVIKPISVLP